MNPDAFLYRFFREQERRAAPRTMSLETRGGGLTREERERIEEWYVAALGVWSRASVEPDAVRVLQAYYLNLDRRHAMVMHQGAADADMQSWVSWADIAARCGLGDGRKALKVWRRGRNAIAAQIADLTRSEIPG